MAYNGIEIDMLSLGDADCILVTRWIQGVPTNILVDGGYARDVPTIEKFLTARGVETIDHLVSTHLHDDHIRGLVRFVENDHFGIGTAWVHQPELHVDTEAIHESIHEALEKTAALKQARLITASVQAEQNLVQALKERQISIHEPFQGELIGCLTVCGPSLGYYKTLLNQYKDVAVIRQLQDKLNEEKLKADVGAWLGKTAGKLLEVPKTQAENLSCTVLGMKYQGDLLLLTADAGAESLQHAVDYAKLRDCRWLQIPHHGSLYNITQDLIDKLRPKTAFVSATGADGHPHPDVVAAFKGVNTTVFSTQKPNRNLRFVLGDVPERDDYAPAVPL